MSSVSDKAAILFKRFKQKIGKLEIDIVSSRSISEKVSLTNNPIEGSFNTDNARDEPTEISIIGIISKYSLNDGLLTKLNNLRKTGDIPNRLKDAHDELYKIKNDKQPISLILPFKTYDNLVLITLDVASNPDDGETFRFTAGFKEVRIVQSQLVSVDNSAIKTDSAKKTSSFGRQAAAPKTFTPPQPKISLGEFVRSLF